MRKAIRQVIYGRPYEVGKGTVAGRFHGGETSNETRTATLAAKVFSLHPKRQLQYAGNFSCTNCEGIVRWSESANAWYHLDTLRQACAGKVEPLATPRLKPSTNSMSGARPFKSY